MDKTTADSVTVTAKASGTEDCNIATLDEEGYGRTFNWNYLDPKFQSLPKGECTLTHISHYGSTQNEDYTCQVVITPEPALALILGLLGLVFAARRGLKSLAAVVAVLAVASVGAAPLVSSVNAYQRWPWDGKVDIVYEIEDENDAAIFEVAFKVKNGEDVLPMTQVYGKAATPSTETELAADRVAGTGRHTLTWNAGSETDIPREKYASLQYFVAARKCELSTYVRVDLTTGAVTTQESAPENWTAEDKSRYLWLKKVEACPEGFQMGSSSHATNPPHTVHLTKAFYMGVFELTRGQYANIWGGESKAQSHHDSYAKPPASDSTSDYCPATKVCWNDLRCSSKTAPAPGNDWPNDGHAVHANSALGKLRMKVNDSLDKGLVFDLPTEAQWEYACRAGHSGNTWNNATYTEYSGASSDANLDVLAWYTQNSGTTAHEVGTRSASDWGFYDMHGNAWELCLDWYQNSTGSEEVTDPTGPEKLPEEGYTHFRVARGGAYNQSPALCLPAYRGSYDPDYYAGRAIAVSSRLCFEVEE